MQEGEIKIRFDAGELNACIATRSPMNSKTWILHFYSRSSSKQIILETQRGAVREFKTLDAIAVLVHKIGFKSYSTHLV